MEVYSFTSASRLLLTFPFYCLLPISHLEGRDGSFYHYFTTPVSFSLYCFLGISLEERGGGGGSLEVTSQAFTIIRRIEALKESGELYKLAVTRKGCPHLEIL